jgi:hypothetical protein
MPALPQHDPIPQAAAPITDRTLPQLIEIWDRASRENASLAELELLWAAIGPALQELAMRRRAARTAAEMILRPENVVYLEDRTRT